MFWVVAALAELLSAFLLINTRLDKVSAASNMFKSCPFSKAECHKALPSMAYINGAIYTVDKSADPEWHKNPQEAMVIEYGIIKFIGSNKDAEDFISDLTEVIDLEGSTVMPGIHDVHMHPLETGNDVAGTCSLSSSDLPDSDRMKNALRKCWRKQEGTDWILGHGYSILQIHQHLEENGRDPKLILDEVIPADKPVLLMEETSHSSWANSEALRRAGIDANTPDPPGGIILRNENGEPNGILLENAGDRLWDMALDPDTYPDLNEYAKEGLKWALKKLAKNGITSICDARTYWGSRRHHKIWRDFDNRGKLTVKTILGLWAYPEKNDEEQIEALKNLIDNDPTKRLRMSQIKVYMDGLIESTTAAVLDEYLINYGIVEGNKGMNYFTKERLSKYINQLQDHGFDFHIHAIGDRGVREALDAIEENINGEARRHRLTHVELIHPDDLPRFARLNIPADCQVPDPEALSEHKEDLDNLIGEYRADRFLPVKNLFDSGATVTLSSDWDVNTVNPFEGIHNAINRNDEDESLHIKEAVEMYTINGAYIMRQEDITGSLKVGKEADFIVLDRDIFQLAEDQNYAAIRETQVLQTILAGEEVWTSRYF